MASNFKKTPPIFSKSSSYEDYKKLLGLWTRFTSLDKNEQGTAVLLSLEGKAQEAVLELETDIITGEDGVAKIIERLDKIYLQDTLIKKYEALDNFENYRRPPDVSVSEYILEFDKRYLKTKNLGTQMSDDLLAYRLLRNANLGDQYTKLVKATSKLEYEVMKQQLKNLFSDATSASGNSDFEPLIPASGGIKFKEEVDTYLSHHDSLDHDHVLYTSSKTPSWKRANDGGSASGKSQGVGQSQQNSGKKSKPQKKIQGKNPLNSNGEITRCHFCQSIYHYQPDCPDKARAKDGQIADKDPEDTFFNSEVVLCEDSLDDPSDLVSQSLNCALLDSGASKSVCGKKWLDVYVDSLSDVEKKKVISQRSDSVFRFGDGNKVQSSRTVTIPACLGSHDISISTDVIDKNIPLLLSKKAMKDVGMNLNFEKDTVTVFGDDIKLRCTSSGHYSLPLTTHCQALDRDKSVSNILSSVNLTNKHAIAVKLHRQFAHPPVKRLLKLIDVSGEPWSNDDELKDALRAVSESCDVCRDFQKPPPRPVVGLPLATTFLECVGMDIKVYDGKLLLHCVDHATRLSMSVRIASKEPRVILTALFKHFISVWGTAQKFLSDNGGEFANSQFIEMCEKLNIRFILTAGESPFSNGLVERHNLVLSDMLDKVLEDTDCGIDIAVAWCVNAKNSLYNIHGFSPFQLAIGKNPVFPVAIDSQPPALTQSSENEIIRKNLDALHKAREAFTESESSEKISRALNHNIRTYNDVKYYNGDTVYFKRAKEKKWRGPAKVLGQDGQQVLLKYGSYYTRSHPCRLKLSVRGDTSSKVCDIEPPSVNPSEGNVVDSDSSDDNDDDDDEDSAPRSENASVEKNDLPSNLDVSNSNSETRPSLKKGMTVKVMLKESSKWNEVKLTSRSGKAGRGKYPNSWNTTDASGQVKSIDFDRDVVDWSEKSLQSSVDEVLVSNEVKEHKSAAVLEAKLAELDTWKQEGVYEEVPDGGQSCMSVRWVVGEKEGPDKSSVLKARLCARGFEEFQDFRTDSPTCKRESVRMVLSTIASNKWNLKSIDIKRAFLQGNKIDRDVFIRPPDEACTDKVWHLKKCVYGLADAPRKWYLTLSEKLKQFKCVVSKYDPGVFMFFHEGKLQGILACFVDDVVHGGTPLFESSVIDKLHQHFKVGSSLRKSFSFLGISLHQNDDFSIVIDQNSYVSTLLPISLSKERFTNKKSDITMAEEKQMRTLIDQLNWLAGISRPEISFDVSLMTSRIKIATVDDLIYCNKVLKQVQTNPTSIRFPPLEMKSVSLLVHFDSSWNNLPKGGSEGAYVILLKDNNNSISPLEWSSTKIRRVARSTVTAETLAMLDACDAVFFLSKIMTEILNLSSIDIHTLTDNKSLYDNVHSSKVTVEKRLIVDLSALREMVNKKEIAVHKIDSDKNLSNVLTKKGAPWLVLTESLQKGKLE